MKIELHGLWQIPKYVWSQTNSSFLRSTNKCNPVFFHLSFRSLSPFIHSISSIFFLFHLLTKKKKKPRQVTTRDDVRLHYYVIPGRTSATIMFAPGLGCASSFSYWAAPVMHFLGDKYTYIYWDYRGLFESQVFIWICFDLLNGSVFSWATRAKAKTEQH